MRYFNLAATIATFGNALIQFIQGDIGAGGGLLAGGLAFLSLTIRDW
jgi:hypothetical protein